LIRAVRPDVLITGGAEGVDEGFAADLVREWGGKVTVADMLPGHSTQATLERIRG
jgi:D-beta-D-heptose 7-phosphate kinase/D-beta-D-heptose 1-phosphate adenosyltransferase